MNKLLSIQVLRGLAALLVVFLHACYDVSHKTNESMIVNFYNLPFFGGLGIDIFFVISGFIMVLTHGNDFKKINAPQVFLVKRLIRIAPLYWIFTLISASILLFFPELFTKGKEFDFVHLYSSLLFFPWYNSVGEVFPVLSVGWSLNVEMYFYFVFALTLFFPKKYFLSLISFILISGIIVVHNLNLDFPYFLMIGKYLILEFLLGVYIGYLYEKNILLIKPKFWFTISLLFILSRVFVAYEPDYRIIFSGIPSAILIFSLLSIEANKNAFSFNKYLLILGNASYSIYITHIFFYKGTIYLIVSLFGEINPDLLIFYALLFSVLGGIFIYYVIEKPMYNFMKIKYLKYLENKSKENNE